MKITAPNILSTVSSGALLAQLGRTVVLAVSLTLAACATTSQPGAHKAPRAADQAHPAQFYTDEDPVANVAYWGSIVETNPKDAVAGLHYGRNLRYVGQADTATKALAQALTANPDNAELLAEYGKALSGIGRVNEGLDYLSKAAALRPKDWTIVTAQGVAYDQLDDRAQAIVYYERALQLSPNNPSILNNLALSQAQQGNLDEAERLLRQAVSQPQASPRARLNLALVLGLKGQFDEARKYAALDLPPVKVEENLDLIRSMQNDPAPWDALKALEP